MLCLPTIGQEHKGMFVECRIFFSAEKPMLTFLFIFLKQRENSFNHLFTFCSICSMKTLYPLSPAYDCSHNEFHYNERVRMSSIYDNKVTMKGSVCAVHRRGVSLQRCSQSKPGILPNVSSLCQLILPEV